MFFLFFFFVYFSFLGGSKQDALAKPEWIRGKENRRRCAGSIGAQRKNEYLMMISLYRLQIDGSRRCWLFFSSSSGYGNRRPISFSFCLWLSPRATWQHLSLMMPSAIRRASWPRAPSLFIASLSWLYTLERKEDFCGTKQMGKRHSAVVRFKSEGAQLGQLG